MFDNNKELSHSWLVHSIHNPFSLSIAQYIIVTHLIEKENRLGQVVKALKRKTWVQAPLLPLPFYLHFLQSAHQTPPGGRDKMAGGN